MAAFKKISGKKAIALVVILAGFLGSYLIARNGGSETGKNLGVSFSEPKNAAFNFERQAKTHALPSKTAGEKIETDNKTDNLIRSYAYEIVKRNPEGLRDQKLTAPPASSLENLLQEKLEEPLDIAFSLKKDLRISKDDSREAAKNYVASLAEVTSKRFKKLQGTPFAMFDELINKNRADALRSYNNLLNSYVADLLAVSIPPSWAMFHLQLVNLQEKKLAVYESLIQMEEDPLKALIALKHLEEINEEDENLAAVLEKEAAGLKS